RLVGFEVGKGHGELIFRYRHRAPVDKKDREGLAPVPLAAEEPVAQLVVDVVPADALLLEPRGDLFLRFLDAQPVDRHAFPGHARDRVPLARRVDQYAVTRVRFLRNVAARYDLADGQPELLGKLVV